MSSTRTSRASRHGIIVFLACACSTAAAAGASAVGCDDNRPTLAPTSGAGGETGAGGSTTGATSSEDKAKQLFDALAPDLIKACGGCHDANGSSYMPFLREPTYESITTWPGIVTKDPTQSKLEVHPVQGGKHSGTNLDSDALKDTLYPQVKAWLAEEAKQIADTPAAQKGKSIDPFTPIQGFNAIYLSSIGKDFEGMEVTFQVAKLTTSALELTQIQVTPTDKEGMHIVHPLFSVYAKNGTADPDPADSFSNVDQYIDHGPPQTLGPGTLILTNWADGAKLQLSFETLDPFSSDGPDGGAGGGGPVGGGCKDIASFQQNAAPQLKQCLQCHGGANAMAAAACDMSGLVNDADDASACAQVKNRVNPDNPPASLIFLTPDQNQEPAHPYKLGQAQLDNFRKTVSVWVAAEK